MLAMQAETEGDRDGVPPDGPEGSARQAYAKNVVHMNEQAIQEIIAAEEAWLQAHLTLDVAAMDVLMHPDYTIIWPSGRVVDKAEALASYQTGERHWDEAHIADLNIRLYEAVAVVTGLWQASGVNAGRSFDYKARYTSVWIQNERRWRLLVDRSMAIES